MTLDYEIEKCINQFKKEIQDRSLIPWEVNPAAKSPFYVGISTNWPNKVGKELDDEVDVIVGAAKQVADERGLRWYGYGPTGAAGGALVMYIGFGQKT